MYRFLAALLALVSTAGWFQAGEKQKPKQDDKDAAQKAAAHVVELRVARHTTAALTEKEADAILDDMTATLTRVDGPGDVACNIRLSRKGKVAVFKTGDGSIDSEAEWKTVLAKVDAEIIVVNQINWCGTPGAGIIGCAPVPGKRLAVVRYEDDQEGILWAHEFGHNKGLSHRDADYAVMRYYVDPSHRRINVAERDAYLAAAALAAPALAQPAQKVDVKKFVRRVYFHGVPWDEASAYKESDVPVLLEMLGDPKEKRFHTNIVATLGLIGDKRAIEPLIKLISQGEGQLAKQEYEARRAAILHLGTLHYKSKDERPLGYLIESVQTPGIWKQRIHWQPAQDQDKRALTEQLTTTAIWGLALTGSDQALQALRPTKDKFSPALLPVVREAAAALETVRDKGLMGYYAMKHKNHDHD